MSVTDSIVRSGGAELLLIAVLRNTGPVEVTGEDLELAYRDILENRRDPAGRRTLATLRCVEPGYFGEGEGGGLEHRPSRYEARALALGEDR